MIVNAPIGALAVLAVVLVIFPAIAGAQVTDPSAIAKDLRAGRPVIEQGLTIRGDIDLTKQGRVAGVFVCKRCMFNGRIIAPHVLFEREVDLSGSTVTGTVNIEGARFTAAALFGPASGSGEDNTTFRDAVDFSFAAFDNLAVFRKATFKRNADFTSVRFRSLARFGEASFLGSAFFDEAIFAGDALFSRTGFALSRFSGAAFGGVADFHQANFGSAALFPEVVFRGRADFSRANMAGRTEFDDARFGADALFAETLFLRKADPGLDFNHAGVHGKLDLDGATLLGAVDLRDASVRLLSLDGIDYASLLSKLYVDGLVTSSASLDLHDVPHVSGDARAQQKILRRAEETAKAEGDLGLANDLHYRLQELASEDDWWLRHVADVVFYRAVAGYFVRPFRPLLWLIGLVFVAAFVRTLQRPRPPIDETKKKPPPRTVARVGWRFIDRLTYTVTPKAEAEKEAASFRRVELTVYAVLLGCFLLALANTNPTLRNMVDTLV